MRLCIMMDREQTLKSDNQGFKKLTQVLIIYMTLANLINLHYPQFLHLKNGGTDVVPMK